MKPMNLAILGTLALLAACSPRESTVAQRQTNFPGMVTAGGGTSGEVMARNKKPKADGSYAGGTPYHAGGADGTTGGTATAGAVSESGHGPSGNTAPPAAKPTSSGQ